MPMTSVTLKPGVNTQYTPSLNEAGVSISNLIRYKDEIIQKLGGWEKYYPLTIDSTIRDIHGWQSALGVGYLAVGATQSLSIIQSGSLSAITPQTRASGAVTYSISSGSNVVTVNAANSSMSVYDTVLFLEPTALGTTFLNGAYPINSILGTSAFTILASAISNSTVASSGILPIFTTIANSAVITVELPNNNFLPIEGLFQNYIAPTSVGGLTVQGRYQTQTVIDSTSYTINALTQATSAGTATMNNGIRQLLYYIAVGPPSGGSGYGIGGYGLGGYGMGSPTIGGEGTPLSNITDWSMDNWGEVLLACPYDGSLFAWSPDSAFTTAAVVPTAPFFNGGIFISQPQQILVCWKSVQSTGVQDPLIVRWCDSGDFSVWTVTTGTTAGSFRIPTGSLLKGGLQAPNYGVIWTDVDVWIQQYVGGDAIFNFTRVGSGCGLIGMHAAGILGGQVCWCGTNNFYTLSGSGVQVMPCSVWDFIFQNLDLANVRKIRCAPNSTFGEITWYFPSAGGAGENDSYVKYNALENQWDYGTLDRNSWIDVTALGNPIGTDTVNVYQHELTNDAAGSPIAAAFESGYWTISEGNDMAFVDWFLPDMKFGTYGSANGAQVEITFKSLDYPGDTPKTYGPYTFTSSTEYLNPRIRGRLMSIRIESNDTGSFWRIGRCRYRWASAGRR